MSMKMTEAEKLVDELCDKCRLFHDADPRVMEFHRKELLEKKRELIEAWTR